MDTHFTERARKATELAEARAAWLQNQAISSDDLLYGLLQSGPNLATAVTNKMGLGNRFEELLAASPETVLAALPEEEINHPHWDDICKDIIDRASMEANELGHKFIGTEHLFLGLIYQQIGSASNLLREAGVEYETVRGELLEFLGVKTEDQPVEEPEPQMEDGVVEVRVKQRSECHDLPLPRYMSEAASGLDLYAAVDGDVTLEPGRIMLVPTGLSIAVPIGYEAQVRPRSGLALKHGIIIVNSPGTIDSDYRGEVGVIVGNLGAKPFVITRGMRIAQMVIQPVVKARLIATEELDATMRGIGGFGSSGV